MYRFVGDIISAKSFFHIYITVAADIPHANNRSGGQERLRKSE